MVGKPTNQEKHLNHPFYKDVETYREKVRIGQIIKGSEKYPEPFTTTSWSDQEIVEHAMQENVDQAHYIYATLERLKEYEEKVTLLRNEVKLWKSRAKKMGWK